ncbi:MAG: carboxypeptidase-like regulatory domain-containing protein, partial [Muribaculaceae bacterium]|nr:carboxypeptidase-like regulatory domain-containing protein [Muribaculaceae bacterium]
VRGKVIDMDDKSEAIGASVILKGTKLGTATDIDGNFAIRVPKDKQLVISYVGYETQEFDVKATIGNEGLVITLKPKDSCMGEVVLVGGVQTLNMPAVDADIYLPDF